MIIRPSAAIRQNYNEIADMCRKTAEPKTERATLWSWTLRPTADGKKC